MNHENSFGFYNFSPDGRLYQIEYAMEATKLGATVFGIKSKAGAVLVIEKKKGSILIENQSIRKLVLLNNNNNIGCYISGLTSDSRLCIEKTKTFLENNSFIYNNINDIEKCAKKIRNLISSIYSGENGEIYINRPLGIAFLLCGLDHVGIRLFLIDPAGNFTEKNVITLGNGYIDVAFIIKEGYRRNMKLLELEKLALKCVRVIMETKISEKDIEVTLLDAKKKKFLFLKSTDLKTIIEKI